MNKKISKLEIEGITYIPESEINTMHESLGGLEYVLVRTYSAGVHCGYLKMKDGKEVTLLDSIRIWKWSGAASLSQLSQEGVNDPGNCKFSMPVPRIELTEAIEVIPMSDRAVKSIKSVPSWKV